jgi:hypothetical protein
VPRSNAGDAHVLVEVVPLDRAHHRQVAGDSDLADAVKLLALPTRQPSKNGPVTNSVCGSLLNEVSPI